MATKKRTIGVRELKNSASKVIDEVERRGVSVTITKNNREVARIVPLKKESSDFLARLRDLDLIASEPICDWSDLELKPIRGIDASRAIQAIIDDRNDE